MQPFRARCPCSPVIQSILLSTFVVQRTVQRRLDTVHGRFTEDSHETLEDDRWAPEDRPIGKSANIGADETRIDRVRRHTSSWKEK